VLFGSLAISGPAEFWSDIESENFSLGLHDFPPFYQAEDVPGQNYLFLYPESTDHLQAFDPVHVKNESPYSFRLSSFHGGSSLSYRFPSFVILNPVL